MSGAVFGPGPENRLTLECFVFEPHGVDPAEPQWPEAVGEALLRLVARAKLRGPCILSVPAGVAWMKAVRSPSVGPEQRAEVVRFEAARSIPGPLDEMAWDWCELADDGVDFDFLVAAARAGELAVLCRGVREAGLWPRQVLPAGVALWRAWRYGNPQAAETGLLMDVGAVATQLIFVRADGRIQSRALVMPAPVDDKQSAEVADFIGRLLREVMRVLAAYTRQVGQESPARILLSGPGARLPGLQEALARGCNLPVGVQVMPAGLVIAAVVKERARLEDHWPVLLGLAAGAAGEKDINLLPVAWQAAAAFRCAQRWWLAVAACLVIGVCALAWHWRAGAAAMQRETERIEGVMAPWRAELRVESAELSGNEAMQRRIEVLRSLLAARSDWAAFFNELEKQFYELEDVWLDRLQILPAMSRGRDESEQAPLRVVVVGRLLEGESPQANAGREMGVKARRLMAELEANRFVAGIEAERYDAGHPGVMRFECILRVMVPAEDSRP